MDLAELVGATGGMGAAKGKGGGARHVALYGNLLAVATDHAMFLLHLTFDVKGEQARAVPLSEQSLRVLETSLRVLYFLRNMSVLHIS